MYDESVDTYALAVTIWEIWSNVEPFKDLSVFKLYEAVKEGKRPPFDTAYCFPPFMVDNIKNGWSQEPSVRPTSRALEMAMGDAMYNYFLEQKWDPLSLDQDLLDRDTVITGANSSVNANYNMRLRPSLAPVMLSTQDSTMRSPPSLSPFAPILEDDEDGISRENSRENSRATSRDTESSHNPILAQAGVELATKRTSSTAIHRGPSFV